MVLIGILTSGIRLATPYLFASIGEMFGQRSGVYNLGVEGMMLMGAFAAFYVALTTGNLWLGLAAITLFGIPNAFFNATVQPWAAERFAEHGQGAVMGLMSTTFCLATILMALVGSALVLVDTRLVLAVGAASSLWDCAPLPGFPA